MKYVALLRGINVGGKNKVEMKKLKQIFEGLGYANVSTYINSGNVLFESKDKDFSKIEPALKRTFGFEIRVLVRDMNNLKKICLSVPENWKNNEENKIDVLFLWDEYCNKKSVDLIKINPEVDTLKYFEFKQVSRLSFLFSLKAF